MRCRRCPGASIPLLGLILLAGASSFGEPFPRTAAAAAVAASGAVEGALEWSAEGAVGGQHQERQRALLMDDEEWEAWDGEEEEEEEEIEEEEEEGAPPCAGFPTFLWGGKPSYFGGQGLYETRR